MPRPTPTFPRLAAALCAAGVLAGCATAPSPATVAAVRGAQNPVDRAQRTITSFTPALRCMDERLFDNGTRDLTLMMEELRDATQKVPVSARDMMTSAIADMTRRSRAVRLSVFGGDQANLTQLLQAAQKTAPFAAMPEYNIRGSISQFDEDVQRRGTSLGLLAETAFGVRLANETRFSVLGFDAAVVRTETLTLVPGAVSKNTTVVARRDASAGDGQGRILGAGAVFAFNAARAEGNAQAARNMVELAAIELVGKLARMPYWQCLGLPDNHPEVQRELDDWFFGMDEGERIAFLKERLRERRWFDGAIDAQPTADFVLALAGYRRALGLPAGGGIDLDFFKRFVTLPARPGPRTLRAAAPAAAQAVPVVARVAEPVAAPAAPAPAPMRVFVKEANAGQAALRVAVGVPGYLYCYAQDPIDGQIRRVFPNRFARDPRVEAGAAVALPGAPRFRLEGHHQHACLHAPREVYRDLPPPLRWGDFEDVRLGSFDEIAQAFSQAAGTPVALVRAETTGR